MVPSILAIQCRNWKRRFQEILAKVVGARETSCAIADSEKKKNMARCAPALAESVEAKPCTSDVRRTQSKRHTHQETVVVFPAWFAVPCHLDREMIADIRVHHLRGAGCISEALHGTLLGWMMTLNVAGGSSPRCHLLMCGSGWSWNDGSVLSSYLRVHDGDMHRTAPSSSVKCWNYLNVDQLRQLGRVCCQSAGFVHVGFSSAGQLVIPMADTIGPYGTSTISCSKRRTFRTTKCLQPCA